MATGRDGVSAGDTPGVVMRNAGATTKEAPRADDEVSCGAPSGATEWGGDGVDVACDVGTLGNPYYKRVPLPPVPEYLNLNQDSQLTKPSVKFAAVEPNIINDYPNGYRKIFGRRRAPITPACE